MDIPFLLYMLEEEGELDTPRSKHKKMIKALRDHSRFGLVDEDEVIREALAAGLEIPTSQEIQEIIEEVYR